MGCIEIVEGMPKMKCQPPLYTSQVSLRMFGKFGIDWIQTGGVREQTNRQTNRDPVNHKKMEKGKQTVSIASTVEH